MSGLAASLTDRSRHTPIQDNTLIVAYLSRLDSLFLHLYGDSLEWERRMTWR